MRPEQGGTRSLSGGGRLSIVMEEGDAVGSTFWGSSRVSRASDRMSSNYHIVLSSERCDLRTLGRGAIREHGGASSPELHMRRTLAALAIPIKPAPQTLLTCLSALFQLVPPLTAHSSTLVASKNRPRIRLATNGRSANPLHTQVGSSRTRGGEGFYGFCWSTEFRISLFLLLGKPYSFDDTNWLSAIPHHVKDKTISSPRSVTVTSPKNPMRARIMQGESLCW